MRLCEARWVSPKSEHNWNSIASYLKMYATYTRIYQLRHMCGFARHRYRHISDVDLFVCSENRILELIVTMDSVMSHWSMHSWQCKRHA